MTSHIVLILFHELQGNPVFGVISLNHRKFLLSQLKFNDFTTKLAKRGMLFKYIKASLYPLLFLPLFMQENQRRFYHALHFHD